MINVFYTYNKYLPVSAKKKKKHKKIMYNNWTEKVNDPVKN